MLEHNDKAKRQDSANKPSTKSISSSPQQATTMPPKILLPASAINTVYLPHLFATQRTQIFFGGAGSGKSVFIASRVALDALMGRNTLVVRQVARSLRSSCFSEVQKAIRRFGLAQLFAINRTEMAITCLANDAQILFLGLDDVEKIKSITPKRGVLTDVWVEEATQTNWADIKQLEKRLRGKSAHQKRLTLSFNPVLRSHWLYRSYFASFPEDSGLMVQDNLLILRTTYQDNRFLSPEDCKALEGESDPFFYQVYTKGLWGQLGGAVLTNWQTAPPPQGLDRAGLRCGLDFGYAQDPAAAVLAHYNPRTKELFILQEFRQSGLTNDMLAKKMAEFAPGLPIICDAAEPKSIAELRRLGLWALPAKKGPDSVLHGLQWLAQQHIKVAPGCPAMQEELANYHWQPDGQGGYLPRPKGQDHLLDALRYALEQDSQGRGMAVRSR